MQSKKSPVFLIIGIFVFGFVSFWIYKSFVLPKVEYTGKSNTNFAQKELGSKRPESSPSNAKSLNLSSQGLEKLPAYVFTRTDLEELNISHNNLTGALPSEIGKLTRLKVLNASNNRMTGVPAEIGHLPNLEVLDLSDNQLTGLPNELAQLKKLKVLNISGNNYSEQDLQVIRKGLSADVNIILD